MGELDGKVAVVTGGSSGIGRASALALARAGAKLVVSDVDVEGGEETCALIREVGGEAVFIEADVTQAKEVEGLMGAVIATFGRLDLAVNNAGISGSLMARIHEMEDDLFDRIMNVNVRGVWLCLKQELPLMMAQGGGAIVNMASIAGLNAMPKGSAYVASKHAVVGLTKTAALEYAKFGIRVNAVCPAYTDTPMVQQAIQGNPAMERLTLAAIPMKRLGKPEEIAEAVLWLCSEGASFVTGHALAVDGGTVAQ